MHTLLLVISILVFSLPLAVRAETVTKSGLDTFDPLKVSSDGLNVEGSVEKSFLEGFLQTSGSPLGGEGLPGGKTNPTDVFAEENFEDYLKTETDVTSKQFPWTIKAYSLFDNLKQTTDPYGDSVITLRGLSDTKLESVSMSEKFNLFNERKQEPLRIITLWEETNSNGGTEEENEPLSWGWSLKSERRPRATKKSSLWD